jgi:hypothetical protein
MPLPIAMPEKWLEGAGFPLGKLERGYLPKPAVTVDLPSLSK